MNICTGIGLSVGTLLSDHKHEAAKYGCYSTFKCLNLLFTHRFFNGVTMAIHSKKNSEISELVMGAFEILLCEASQSLQIICFNH